MNAGSQQSALKQGFKGCECCHAVVPLEHERCPVCGSGVEARKPHSIQKTIAWLITSILFFIPANTLPVMKTLNFGRVSESTILEGAVHLWEDGSYLISSVIILASIIVPLAKIFILGYLSICVLRGCRKSLVERTRAYEVTELLGKWSMIDVFVVMNLVTLVQLGHLMSIQSSPGVLAFAGVVLSTMFAANSFDPRLLWDIPEVENSA